MTKNVGVKNCMWNALSFFPVWPEPRDTTRSPSLPDGQVDHAPVCDNGCETAGYGTEGSGGISVWPMALPPKRWGRGRWGRRSGTPCRPPLTCMSHDRPENHPRCRSLHPPHRRQCRISKLLSTPCTRRCGLAFLRDTCCPCRQIARGRDSPRALTQDLLGAAGSGQDGTPQIRALRRSGGHPR